MGPLSVNINTGDEKFYFYKSGQSPALNSDWLKFRHAGHYSEWPFTAILLCHNYCIALNNNIFNENNYYNSGHAFFEGKIIENLLTSLPHGVLTV